jgi:hypothetical protein
VRINFNPNAVASKIIEQTFNSCISSGIDVCVVGVDKVGVTLAKWRPGNALPKAFTLVQRVAGGGVCIGGYLKNEYTAGFDLQGKKCFISQGGTFMNPTIKIRLDTALKRLANKDVALISFDPQYSE